MYLMVKRTGRTMFPFLLVRLRTNIMFDLRSLHVKFPFLLVRLRTDALRIQRDRRIRVSIPFS